MSGHIDIERSLDQFLADGPVTVADGALQHTLDEIDRTPQRRGPFAPGRQFLMFNPTRLAGLALVAIVAVGGAIYVLGPRSSTGGPGASPTPTPTLAPTPESVIATLEPSASPTPFPTVNPDTATWKPFTSFRYGYSLAYPPGWAVANATVFAEVPGSRFEFWSSPGDSADRFINSFKPRDLQEHLTAMAALVPAGVTDTAWIDAWETLPDGFTLDPTDCLTTAAEMSAITIAGHDGRISTKCEMAAFLFVDGWMYLFSVDGDEALFRAFLSTFQLPAPAPSST